MIYTVTFNPCLDYIITTDEMNLGVINRTTSELILTGGKGINVSIVLKNLGINSKMLGFIGGFTGEQIEKILNDDNCETDFIKTKKGLSRINVKIKALEETEINGMGAEISSEELEELYKKLENLKENDILVLGGSVPTLLPSNIYEIIMAKMENKKVKIVVDATKDLLLNVLKFKPFLIKPNNHEISEIFNKELKTEEDLIAHGKKLQEMGAENVLISMAGDGAILLSSNGEVYKSPAPKGVVVNSVGAGDSMVAGFLTGYIENNGDLKKAFKMGVATGSASAFSKFLATKIEVENILKNIKE